MVQELQAAEDAGQRAFIIGHMPMGKEDALNDQVCLVCDPSSSRIDGPAHRGERFSRTIMTRSRSGTRIRSPRSFLDTVTRCVLISRCAKA